MQPPRDGRSVAPAAWMQVVILWPGRDGAGRIQPGRLPYLRQR